MNINVWKVFIGCIYILIKYMIKCNNKGYAYSPLNKPQFVQSIFTVG